MSCLLLAWVIGGCAQIDDTGMESDDGIDVLINELMADNESTVANEDGEYDDWIELYNPSDNPVSLIGLYITDDLANPKAFTFSDVSIPAQGFVLIWADKKTSLGSHHLPFSLDKDGEEIGLSYEDEAGNVVIMDALTFGVQEPDISYGRSPDGGTWQSLDTPSPGTNNP